MNEKATDQSLDELEQNIAEAMEENYNHGKSAIAAAAAHKLGIPVVNVGLDLNPELIAQLKDEGRVAFAGGSEPIPPSYMLPAEGHAWLHGYFAAKAQRAAEMKGQVEKGRKKPRDRVARAEKIDATLKGNITEVLAGRQPNNGKFAERAEVAQNIKAAMRKSRNWETLTPEQTEALEMIAHKISRILSGNASLPDHWLDIAGYANLPNSGL